MWAVCGWPITKNFAHEFTRAAINGSSMNSQNTTSDLYGVSYLIDGGIAGGGAGGAGGGGGGGGGSGEGAATNIDKIIASLERNDAGGSGDGGSQCGSDPAGCNSDEGGSGRGGKDGSSFDDMGNGSTDETSVCLEGEEHQPAGPKYDASYGAHASQAPPRPYIDPRKEMEMKREVLYQIDRLAKKGIAMPRAFTLSSSLEEMQAELERLKRDRAIDKSVNFQRYVMMTAVSGLEMLTNNFASRYVKLDGWSNHVNENVHDFDDIFEELHAKWSGKAKMPPELRLILSLGGSAAMFQMTNTIVKKYMPGMEQVMKSNPGLMKQVNAAMMSSAAGNMRADEEKEGSGNFMSGMFNMMAGMMGGGAGVGGGGGGGPHGGDRPHHPQPHFSGGPSARAAAAAGGGPPVMKGPRNFDSMMKELNSGSRLETFSNASETDISELRDDTRSVSGYSLTSRSGRKVLNI